MVGSDLNKGQSGSDESNPQRKIFQKVVLKTLLTITSIFEFPTGLALTIVPGKVFHFLFGASLLQSTGEMVGRIAGIALIALSLACWFARNEFHSSMVLTKSMLIYNLGIVIFFLLVLYEDHLSGVGFWPAIVLHTALAGWCLKNIVGRNAE